MCQRMTSHKSCTAGAGGGGAPKIYCTVSGLPADMCCTVLPCPMFQVVDALEDELTAGGCLVDYHSCDFFPERCVGP